MNYLLLFCKLFRSFINYNKCSDIQIV